MNKSSKKVVAYLPAGFPDFKTSLESFKVLVDLEVDIIEVGVPYSDPVMDGEVIQNAAKQALQAGFKFSDIYKVVSEIKSYAQIKNNPSLKIYVMGYWNMFWNDDKLEKLKNSGVDGLIIPDLPVDEATQYCEKCRNLNIETVFLTAINSPVERLKLNAKQSTGFIYASSLLGTTGVNDNQNKFVNLKEYIEKIQHAKESVKSETPIYVGLGVSNKDDVQKIHEYADGAIIGSKLVAALDSSGVGGLRKEIKKILL